MASLHLLMSARWLALRACLRPSASAFAAHATRSGTTMTPTTAPPRTHAARKAAFAGVIGAPILVDCARFSQPPHVPGERLDLRLAQHAAERGHLPLPGHDYPRD